MDIVLIVNILLNVLDPNIDTVFNLALDQNSGATQCSDWKCRVTFSITSCFRSYWSMWKSIEYGCLVIYLTHKQRPSHVRLRGHAIWGKGYLGVRHLMSGFSFHLQCSCRGLGVFLLSVFVSWFDGSITGIQKYSISQMPWTLTLWGGWVIAMEKSYTL